MLGYERDLYMLAFDHRGSFQKELWWDALVGFRDGKLSRAEAAKQIAALYLRGVDGWRAAAA